MSLISQLLEVVLQVVLSLINLLTWSLVKGTLLAKIGFPFPEAVLLPLITGLGGMYNGFGSLSQQGTSLKVITAQGLFEE